MHQLLDAFHHLFTNCVVQWSLRCVNANRYIINPTNDINFGALMLNTKKTRTFTIENTGEKFDLKYTITKALRDDTRPQVSDGKTRRG